MEKDSLKYNTLKGKINQILLENKVFFERRSSDTLTQKKLKSLGIIVSNRSKKLDSNIYNRESEFIIDYFYETDNVKQLEDMIYRHCRIIGWVYDEDDNLIRNLVPEQTYKEGKYKKIAQEIFPLIVNKNY